MQRITLFCSLVVIVISSYFTPQTFLRLYEQVFTPDIALPTNDPFKDVYSNDLGVVSNNSHDQVPTSLLMAVIVSESEWNPRAIRTNPNGSKDVGLLQLNTNSIPTFEKLIGKKINPYSISDSIHAGMSYLSYLYTRLGSWKKAIMAYNCGPYAVETGRIPARTQIYAKKVIALWQNFDRVLML